MDQVIITPDAPMPLAGYATRNAPFQGVDTDLHAKALALEDASGNRTLIITAEILGFPSSLAEEVCRRLRQSAGLERKAILLNGSHTHSGPVVALEMGWPPAGPNEESIKDYVARLTDKLVETALKSLRNMQPARLEWGVGVAQFVTNRREVTERGVVLGVNPRGPTDRSVPVLRVATPDGRIRAVLFGASAHPVTLGGDHLRVNGDYVGYAMTELEQTMPGVQAMFVAGCGGDASPFPRGSIEAARTHGKNLAAEVSRVLGGKLKPLGGPMRAELRWVELPLKKFSRTDLDRMSKGAARWQQYFIGGAIGILDRGGNLPESYSAPFALWQFGGDLTLAAFSGETVVDYVLLAEQRLGPLNLWVAGYSNDLFGYLPSARVLREGGYETRGLYMGYGLFDPSVENVVMDAMVEMARAAGRRVQ
jgi:hypothetical protein